MSHTGQFEIYRKQAAKCIDIAHRSSDPECKRALLDMAQSWLALAEQADKNSQTVLVYETPEPRQHVAPQQQQQQSHAPDDPQKNE